MRGFEIQGKLDLKKPCSILSLSGYLSLDWWVGHMPLPQMSLCLAQISPAVPQLAVSSCALGGWLSFLGAVSHTCSS